MLQSLLRQKWPFIFRLLTGFAVAPFFLVLVSGCSDRERPGDGGTARATGQTTAMELFVDNCASCHGVDGSGNGPLANELRIAPANLRLLKQSNDGSFPSLAVRRSIDGRAMPRAHGLPDMPVWGRYWLRQGLDQSEVDARVIMISSYIASIQD